MILMPTYQTIFDIMSPYEQRSLEEWNRQPPKKPKGIMGLISLLKGDTPKDDFFGIILSSGKLMDNRKYRSVTHHDRNGCHLAKMTYFDNGDIKAERFYKEGDRLFSLLSEK